MLLSAIALTAAIGFIDYLTSPELSSFAFYAIPILLVTSSEGRLAGFLMALCCAAVWALALGGGTHYQTGAGLLLALASRFVFFALVVVAASAARERREADRERIEVLERTRRLEEEVRCIEEREQQRIGRELHDGLCQDLAGIAALSTTLSRRLKATASVTEAASAEEIAGLLHEAIGEARDLARGLNPGGGVEASLPDALRRLALNIQRRFEVACTVESPEDFPALAEWQKVHLLRIAQEAVRNAVDHGKAKMIEIRLACRGAEGSLVIRDHGAGLGTDAPGREGMGKRTMRERARLLGGTLDIRGHKTTGTIVTCTFPVPGNGERSFA